MPSPLFYSCCSLPKSGTRCRPSVEHSYIIIFALHAAYITEFTEDSVLPQDASALLALPPTLFSNIRLRNRGGVGFFFASYKEPTLFPVRVVQGEAISLSQSTAIASVVVAATVASGHNFTNLEVPVEIYIRTDSLTTSFRVRLNSLHLS